MADFLQLFVDLFWCFLGAMAGGVVCLFSLAAIPTLGPVLWCAVQLLGLSTKVAARFGVVLLALGFVALTCAELWVSWKGAWWLVKLCDFRHADAFRVGSAFMVCSAGYLTLTLVSTAYWDHIDVRMRRSAVERQTDRRGFESIVESTAEITNEERKSTGLPKRASTEN